MFLVSLEEKDDRRTRKKTLTHTMDAPASVPPPAPAPTGNAAALRDESRAYLQSLLNKNLLVHTTDGRMFRGEFKCTDPVGPSISSEPI